MNARLQSLKSEMLTISNKNKLFFILYLSEPFANALLGNVLQWKYITNEI